MKKLFGTDGIRSVAGEAPLDKETLGRIGWALVEKWQQAGTEPRIIVGRDTRASGEWITAALVQALTNSGIDAATDVGVISTPGLAYLTRLHQFDLGIMISASHNPYQDNGIKVFGRDGFKLSDAEEVEIERLIDEFPDSQLNRGTAAEPSRLDSTQLAREYVNFLKNQTKAELSSLRIGLDLCNGSAHAIAPTVFRELGASVQPINDKPDGKNINLNCGSLHLPGLISLVKERQLDLGVAFDGDADRSLFVTASGKVFDGDYVLFALALHFQGSQQLKGNRVVGTIMSNYALERSLNGRNIDFLRAAVGDRYVLEMMRVCGANLGGEPSGHVILSDCHTAGDGILTAVKLAEVLVSRGVSLDALADEYHPYPQVLDGLKVRQKIPLETPDIADLIQRAEDRLGDSGRLVVRYSGTEPLLLRIMAEGADGAQVQALVRQLKSDMEVLLMGLLQGS
ncbi:MAG: phosphoglucosamine mutase [Acidobacteria bacterium]|nr:phosphoglucosamine mutase [Acidobacteriota bacterium]MCI0717582.1 phosphoglucosamine mutase [Acidobacteriota bacterium]